MGTNKQTWVRRLLSAVTVKQGRTMRSEGE